MSHVSSMILTCALIEDEEDGGLAAFHEWCSKREPRPVRFGVLDDNPAANGKSMQCHILACAANYFNEDDLIAAFPTFPWMFPKEAVLVIHPEHYGTRIVTGDPQLGGMRERAQELVDKGDDDDFEVVFAAKHILGELARDR